MTGRNALSRAHVAAVVHQWQDCEQCRWLPVVGDSMWPQLRQGDAVLVRFSTRPPRPGDVALVRPAAPVTVPDDVPDDVAAYAPLLLHRVIGLADAGATVITQGDNRLQPDSRHARTAVYGTVIARRRAGVVRRWDHPAAGLMAMGSAWAVRSSILPFVLRVASRCGRRARIFTTQGVTPHA